MTQIGTPEDIRTAPRSRYAAALVGVNAFHGLLESTEEGAGKLATDEGESWSRGPTASNPAR